MANKDDKRSRAYNDDKRELLKLKQGLINEEESSIKEEENGYGDKVNYEVVGVKNKVANFFYHYKWHVIIITFFVALAAFLVITTVLKEKGDIRVLGFSKDPDISSSLYYKSRDLELALEQFTPDFDNNGYTHVEFFYMNLNEEQDINYYYVNQSKLFSEVGTGVAQIYIADRELLLDIMGNQTEAESFVDLSRLYPDDPNVVDKYYYRVKGSSLADAAMYVESCPEDMFIAVRSESFSSYNQTDEAETAENHSRAIEVMDNIVKGIKVSEKESSETD